MSLSIGQKIVIGFSLVFVLTLGFGVYQLRNIDNVKTFSDQIVSDNVEIHRLQGNLSDSQGAMKVLLERTLVNYFLSKDNLFDVSVRETIQEWRSAREKTRGLIKEIKDFSKLQEEKALTEERKVEWRRLAANAENIEQVLVHITSDVEGIFKLIDIGKSADLVKNFPGLDKLRRNFSGRIDAGEEIARKLVDIGRRNVFTIQEESQRLSIIVLAILLAISVFIAVYLYRSITVPLLRFMGLVERIGQGDLTQKTGLDRGDELGQLARYLDQMVDGLRTFASQSRAGAENLNSAAAETLASTKQQAASVEEQFAAVQETTATLEEITQSGTQISNRAKELTTAAEAASSAGQAGLDSLSETVGAMDSIREQAEAVAENIVLLSEKTQTIGEIITTVNDIAERSHLLALNAAIEAASAGEAGGGFSVVANEIKNLADQAKESTSAIRANLSEIQQSINTSVMLTEEAVKRVATGKEKTDSSQKTVHQLTENIQESVQAFQQIVAATNQQQIGLEQVTQALESIRQASEQTAAGTKQVEEASTNLSALGEQLLRMAGSYKL